MGGGAYHQVKSEIITDIQRKPQRQEIWYFVNRAQCSEDKNTWEPQESLENSQEIVEEFH